MADCLPGGGPRPGRHGGSPAPLHRGAPHGSPPHPGLSLPLPVAGRLQLLLAVQQRRQERFKAIILQEISLKYFLIKR